MSVCTLHDSDDSAAFRFTLEEMKLVILQRTFLLSPRALTLPSSVVDLIVAFWCPAQLHHTVGQSMYVCVCARE